MSNKINSDYSPIYINNLIKLLPRADILEPKDKPINYLVIFKIKSFTNKIFTWLSRVKHKLFTDGIWYNETKARQLVIDYMEKPGCQKALNSQHQRIMEIYDHLAQLSKGKGTWADGIDKEALINQEHVLKFEEPDEENFVDLHALIEEEKLLNEDKVDEKDLYSFTQIKHLKAPSKKTLFHIQADEFGQSSELEGSKSKLSVDYLISYLKGASQNNNETAALLYAQVIQELEQAVCLQDSSSNLQEIIKNAQHSINNCFQSKKPLLIMGGWTGIPSGHAVYYEVIPTSEKKASLRIYNTGAGIDYHHSDDQGNKVKYQTYCEWTDIDRERLESPYFIEALYEMHHHSKMPDNIKKTEYGEQDIYEALKCFLKPKEEKKGPEFEIDPHLMMSPQRSGVCSWKSLMAVMRTKLDLEDYKRFKCNIKLQSLADFVVENSSPVTSQDWRLVKKSHQSLSRSIIKLYQKKLVGKTYLETAQKTLEPISEWIHQHSNCRYARNIQEADFNYQSATQNNKLHVFSDFLGDPLNQQITSPSSILAPPSLPLPLSNNFKQLNLQDPLILLETFKQINALCDQTWNAKEDLALYTGLVDIISRLSLDKKFWETAISTNHSKKAEELIVELGKFSNFFMKSCFTSPDAYIAFSENFYVSNKILFIQDLLCKLGHPASDWKRIELGNKLNVNEIPYLSFFDSKMQSEMQIIMTPIKAKKSEVLKTPIRTDCYNIPYKAAVSINESSDLSFCFEERSRLEKTQCFETLIRESYPETIEAIAKQNKDFFDLPTFKQDAIIYTSDLLPDWVEAIRDAQVNCHFLINAHTGPLPTINRTKDLKIEFKTYHDEKTSRIDINLSGMNTARRLLPKEISNRSYELNKDLHYAGQYREIKTQSIKKLLNLITSKNWDFSEKELLTTVKNPTIEMSDEEFKELARLFSSSNLQCLETLEYFTKYPEKLKENDYQVLFQMLLFKGDLLKTFLKKDKSKDLLIQFIERNYSLFHDQNDSQSMVFLLKVAHQLKGFISDNNFFNTKEKLYKLLSSQGIEIEERLLIYAELIAQFNRQQDLSDSEVKTLLEGMVFLQENQSQSQYQIDAYTSKEASQAFVIHHKTIQKFLEKEAPNQELLNGILGVLRPDVTSNHIWIMTSKAHEFPVFATTDGKHAYYPFDSRLFSPDSPTFLPLKIRQNPLFRQLFPNIEVGEYYPGNIFSFKDSQGYETLVSTNEEGLIIEQKLENHDKGWYCYVPSELLLKETEETIESLLGSRYLVHHCSHWRPLERTADGSTCFYAKDLKTGKKSYLLDATHSKDIRGKDIRGKFIIKEVIQLESDLKLGKSSSLLQTIEDPAYIHEWYTKDDQLSKIDLPRFNLSFKPHPQNSKQLICEQFPAYTLNTTDPVKELGVHHHFVLLTNAAGQHKAILPNQDFLAPKKQETLLPRYKMDQKLKQTELVSHNYFIFDLQKNGKLFSKSREANLYLAQALTTAQEYKKAAYYLKEYGEKLSSYTPAESKILEGLSNISNITGDRSGNGIVLQLYASYLLNKNKASHHIDPTKEEIQALANQYDLYLNHYHATTVFKLKKHEEIYLLKTLLGHQFNSIYFLRLKELDPKASQQIQVPASRINHENQIDQKYRTLKEFDIPEAFKKDASIKTIDKTLLTRPHQAMQEHFIYYYEIARIGSSKDKQRLRESLHFLKTVEKGKHKGMAHFFEAVLENPAAFPLPLQKKDFSGITNYLDRQQAETKASDNWKRQVKAIAEGRLGLKPEMRLIGKIKTKPIDITQTHLHLDSKQVKWPAIKLNFSLPTLTSFADEARTRNLFEPVLEQSKKGDQSGLFHVLHTCKSQDSVQQQEVDRLTNGLSAYQKLAPLPSYTLKHEQISKASQLLTQDKVEDKKRIAELEKSILALANKELSADIVPNQLKKWAGLRKVITLEELIVNFARPDSKALLQRNPSLTGEEMNELFEKVGSYLLYANRDQQRTRAEHILNQLIQLGENQETTQAYQDITNQLAQEMGAIRAYDPATRPSYLVFEYFVNLSMRTAQVDKLERFLKEGDSNLVMEMIMGSGKSKILLPLLGLMRADGKDLSMLIVPQFLFESVSQDTQEMLQGFSQALRSLHFDRHTTFTKQSLETILDDLKQIKDNKECLIMTSKSVACLSLKFVEKSLEHLTGPHKNEAFPEDLQIMRQIMTILSESGYPILDEADSILNVLKEVSFSIGNRLYPQSDDLKVLSELYSLVYRNPIFKKMARLESDPQALKEAPIFTEQLYHEKMKQPLASAFIDHLKKMRFDHPSLNTKMQTFMEGLNDEKRLHLMHYLCRDKTHLKSAQAFYDRLDPEVQDTIALAGEEISHLLPYTLTRISNERYGLDEESGNVLAIPFAASHTPSIGSQFSNPHITMNYTYQAYVKEGVTAGLIESQIKLLQGKAMQEMAASDGKLEMKDTLAGQAFEKLKNGLEDIPLFNYRPIHIKRLVEAINSNPEKKLVFVQTIILPHIHYFEHKLSFNPQNLVSMFKKVKGFTGTLWNSLSMHHTLQPEPEITVDAKTLSILWEHSQSNAISIKEGSTQEMLSQLESQGIAYDMISDAGGYFKEGKNSEIAHQIALRTKEEVVFYNSQGEQTITDGLGEMPLSQSTKSAAERKTLLDQSRTTGADVPQKRDAISLVTIGRHMLLRDLLQSVWRLRGLDKSQRVRFLVSDEVASIIRQSLNLKDQEIVQFDSILKFVLKNQAAQQGQDNRRALKQELQNLPQQILLKVLLSKKVSSNGYVKAFEALQSYWIKPAVHRPRDVYGKLIEEVPSEDVLKPNDVLKLNKEQAENQIQEIFTKLPWLDRIGIKKDDYLKEIASITARIKNSLPASTTLTDHDVEQTTEIEQETQTEIQTEVEVEQAVLFQPTKIEFIKYHNELLFFDSFQDALIQMKKFFSVKNIFKQPFFPLNSYMKEDKDLASYASAFSDINITFNVLSWSPELTNLALLGPNRIDFHHFLIDDQSSMTLLSQTEANKEIKNKNYYNLTLGFVNSPKKPSERELQKIIKFKFLNGESHFNLGEIKLLEEWFKKEGASRMQTLYIEKILPGFPNKQMRYADSPLQKLFNKMKIDEIKLIDVKKQ